MPTKDPEVLAAAKAHRLELHRQLGRTEQFIRDYHHYANLDQPAKKTKRKPKV